MYEVAPPVYLFPDEKGVVVTISKSGCPFGYTADNMPEDGIIPPAWSWPTESDEVLEIK